MTKNNNSTQSDIIVSSSLHQTPTTSASFDSNLRRFRSFDLKESLSITSSPTFKLFMNSVIASSVSNVAGIAVTHPLDTLKIRMQMATRTISMRQCAYEAITEEGAFGLYKGLSQPVIASVPISMIAFSINELSK